MTLTDFIVKWQGKYCDFDGWYGNQCMDLMHQYCVEVLGISDPAVLRASCAKDVYTNFQNVTGNDLFTQIGNTPTGVPNEGDIVFWGSGEYGHVAIFVEGDTNSFRSFDQNYPVGTPCHIQNHTYANVLGWLRFKGQPISDNQQLIDQLRSERDANWNLYQQEREAKIDLETQIDQKNKTISVLEKMIEDKDKEIASLSASLQELKTVHATTVADNAELKSTLQKTKMDLEICLAQRKDLAKYTTKELWNEIINRFLKRG